MWEGCGVLFLYRLCYRSPIISIFADKGKGWSREKGARKSIGLVRKVGLSAGDHSVLLLILEAVGGRELLRKRRFR